MSSVESNVNATNVVIDESAFQRFIERGYSERFVRAVLNPRLINEPVDVELAAEYLLATMDDPKRQSILSNRGRGPAPMYYALACSNRYDLVDLLGAHPVHGYNQPDSYEINAILTNSMFQNHEMLAHITSKIHKVSEDTFKDILLAYIDGLDNVFEEIDDGTKKLSDYKPEFDVLNKYYYAKYQQAK